MLITPFIDSQEALRSLLVSQYALETNEIAVFHHTGCGMTVPGPGTADTGPDADAPRLVVAEFRETLLQAARSAQASQYFIDQIEQMSFLELEPLDGSVKRDVARLREHPLFRDTIITGWVHEVQTGRVSHSGFEK